MTATKVAYIRTQFWFGLRSGGSVGHTIGVLDGFRKNGAVINVLSNEKFYGTSGYEYFIREPLLKGPPWLGELIYNFLAKRSFKEKILQDRPDIIYHRYTGYTFFVTALAKSLKIPIVLEFNSFDTWKLKHWERSRNVFKRIIQGTLLYYIVKRIEDYNLSGADLITTVSDPLKDDLIRSGISPEKILVNPNGFDSERFEPGAAGSSESKAIREKYGKNRTVIGFCGTFGPWHGIPQLTEAIGRILDGKEPGNVHFLIMGDGGHLKKHMTDRLSKYDEVTFTGSIPYSSIHHYLAACDILVSPHNPPADSREFFGSPTKIFEYMGVGKGIVASDLGQISEILEDRKTAILVPPGEVGDLVNAILELAANKELRDRLGSRASGEVFGSYTWEKNIKRLMEKLDESGII